MNRLLLEIGVEEIPARFLPDVLINLKETCGKLLEENSIEFSSISTYATPRRLTLTAEGLPELQTTKTKETFGPPKKAAFDEHGNPTKAAMLFASSSGVAVENLIIRKKGKGEYIAAIVEEKGLSVKELIPGILKKLILSLHFPKSMRWADGNLRFVRPIHWIVALFGPDVIEFEIDGIRSGGITRGHRFLSPGAFQIRDPKNYFGMLENNFVIADQGKRRLLIEEQIKKLSSSVSGKPVEDEELLTTVSNLVEYPSAVLCSFPEEYLKLPEELLITVMKGHQKYFSVKDNEGHLINYFIAISNTRPENAVVVRSGAERVLKARFEDARFYYEEDTKKSLAGRVNELKKVTFHDRLGSLYDKTMRIKAIAVALSEKVYPSELKNIERAATLSKTDLITGVVREFPELQGIMGRYYAVHDKEKASVSQAIMEHYLPRHSGDRLPTTDAGSIVGIADRIDNIAAFFLVGLTATGSEDPFALRRQALAIAAILKEKEYGISVESLLEMALSNLKHIKGPDVKGEILRFFEQRLEQLLIMEGFQSDLIQSVISRSMAIPLIDVIKRLESLKEFSSSVTYNVFLIAFKRVRNIIGQRKRGRVKKELLKEKMELALYEKHREVREHVSSYAGDSKYIEALRELEKLVSPINDFFDNVLVMDKDEALRENRLNLLGSIWETALTVADFSKLQEKTL